MLSQTAEYALRTVLHIAQHAGEGPARTEALATALRIPPNYLAKILHRLAQAGVLTSSRGRNGGFTLAQSPRRLSLAEVVGHFDRLEPRRQCLLGQPVCSEARACAAHARWVEASDVVARFYRETMVTDLLGEAPAARRDGRERRATRGEG